MTTATLSRAPRISVMKLAEYMETSATRRRQIIQDQKWPSDYIVPTYTEAQEIISGYVRRRASNPDTIENEINRLLRVTPTSSWHERRIALCIEALKAFMNIAPNLDLANYSLRQTGNHQPKLRFANVDISVRPELLLVANRKEQSVTAGAIKLYFSKGHSLSEASGKFASTLLHQYALQFADPAKTSKASDCLVIDVFAEQIHVAPKMSKRRINEISNACAEIAAQWETIPAPKATSKIRSRTTTIGTSAAGKATDG